MKQLKFILIAFTITLGTYAQRDFSTSVDGVQWVKIETKAKVVLTATQGNKMTIKVRNFHEIPEKAKGLTLVGNNGSDNTGIGFSVEKDGNTLVVKNLRNGDKGEAEILIPASQNISIVSSGLDDLEISGFKGEVEATAQVVGDVTIKDVTGPVTVSSNTGDVEVVFNDVNQSSPISISTTTGNIDVTIPQNTPATLTLNSTMGEIYSNFDLSVADKDGLKTFSTRKVERQINNGGVLLKLNSSTGDIYLRKK